MLISNPLKLRFALATITITIVTTSLPAAAAILYSVTEIGNAFDYRDTINNSGDIVLLGKTFNSKGQRVEGNFLIDSDGTKQDLGRLYPDVPEEFIGGTSAYAINDSSQVVGNSGFDAFFWTEETGIVSIASAYSSAYDINNQGLAVGTVGSPGSGTRGFLYNGNTGVRTILPGLGGEYSFYNAANGINEKGDIVGAAYDGMIPQATIYSDGVVQNLNDLIYPDSGWILESTVDINDLGQIIGNGIFNGQQRRGFLLTPMSTSKTIPESSTIFGISLFGTVAAASILKRQVKRSTRC